MKVNMSCVVKYLKHDYKNIFVNVIIVVIAIAIAAVMCFMCINGPAVVWPYISSYCTAYNVLNSIVGAIVVAFTFGISTLGNKETFLVKTKSEYDGSIITTEWDSGEFIAIAGFCAFFLYVIYILWMFMSTGKLDVPIYSIVVFAILILIGTPIGCAIARCKEE